MAFMPRSDLRPPKPATERPSPPVFTRALTHLLSPLIAGIVVLFMAPQLAVANTVQEAEQLLRQKQPQQALEKIDAFLGQYPRDPQGRFFRGLILTELGRSAEATSVFLKLTEDYPELPEPYNNLAVLYAQQKQFDKAKTALEMAIRTHPSYAVAHENLGDIYARMATQAYDRALQLDSSNKAAQTKLNLIREMVSNGSRDKGTKPVLPLANVPAAAAAPAAPTKAESKSEPRSEPRPAAPAPAAPTAAPVPAQKAVAPAVADSSGSTRDAELKSAVESWAAAWAGKNVKGYLAHYADDFKVPGGKSRKAWESERRTRIDKPGAIEVKVENISVKRDDANRATVTFRQHYRAVGLKTSTTKTLTLVRRGDRWLIQQERVGG